MATLRTDYLVVGAGASGMAFVDALVDRTDADVVLVDRRPVPGGHWADAYPFARLHQPSAYYGVDSTPLGRDRVLTTGPEAGFHERATATEICAYYERVLEERLLASGRVRFLGTTDHVGGTPATLVSRLTGRVTTVQVRRRVVDATYLEAAVPARHRPAFTVDPGVRLIDPGGLTRTDPRGAGVTVFGAGKTAMDTVVWLLEAGMPPETIQWIRPRDPWVLDRRWSQSGRGLPWFVEGLAVQLEAAAAAVDVPELFARLEAAGQLVRLAPSPAPSMFRGAVLSAREQSLLAQVEDVVRLGRVTHLAGDRIVLRRGEVATHRDRVHVDCTASGLPLAAPRPVFGPGRITLQMVQTGVVPLSAALVAVVEASERDDVERNRLCPPNPAPSAATDWIRTTWVTQSAHAAWRAEPDVTAWLRGSRLNALRGLEEHLADPAVRSAVTRLRDATAPALANLARLQRQIQSTVSASASRSAASAPA